LPEIEIFTPVFLPSGPGSVVDKRMPPPARPLEKGPQESKSKRQEKMKKITDCYATN